MHEQSLNRNQTRTNYMSKDFEHKEGRITKMIEDQTAKIPSGTFLAVALGSMALSFGLAITQGRNNKWANFIGQWAPTLLIMGLYNKIVKTEGSDKTESLH